MQRPTSQHGSKAAGCGVGDTTGKQLLPSRGSKCGSEASGGETRMTGGATSKTSGESGRSTIAKTAGNECFMKHATNNKSPSECGTGKGSGLKPISDIKLQPADYSEVTVDNEADLILSRGDGLYHWRTLPLEKMFVCERHYNWLGRGWKRRQQRFKKTAKLKCMVPQIEGCFSHNENEPKQYSTYVTKEESEATLVTKRLFIPPGTGM
jgi:hypothetical protein